jgi:hypothetical protein
MLRKSIVIILILGIIDLIIISCCPDPITYTSDITGIRISNTKLQTTLADGAIVSKSDFRIRCVIEEETLQAYNFGIFSNSALATSCEDNFVGLRSNIIDFRLTCNKKIFDIEPGQPIGSNLISVYKIGFYDDSKNSRKTMNEWLTILNEGGYQLAYEWYLEFKQEVVTEEYLEFSITVEQANGKVFTAHTEAVKLN